MYIQPSLIAETTLTETIITVRLLTRSRAAYVHLAAYKGHMQLINDPKFYLCTILHNCIQLYLGNFKMVFSQLVYIIHYTFM